MSADMVIVNVGGMEYTTSVATLARFPDSRLGQLVRDGGRHFFVDRDGPLFRIILTYLRNNRLLLPDDFAELQALRFEAIYYTLPGLVAEIDQLAANIRERKTLRLEERIVAQCRPHRGTFTEWIVTSVDPAPILWLSEVGVFVADDATVTVDENETRLHRAWYNGIRALQQNDYVVFYGVPQPVINRADVLDEIRSLGYRLIDVSPINDNQPPIEEVLRPFVNHQSARMLVFQLE